MWFSVASKGLVGVSAGRSLGCPVWVAGGSSRPSQLVSSVFIPLPVRHDLRGKATPRLGLQGFEEAAQDKHAHAHVKRQLLHVTLHFLFLANYVQPGRDSKACVLMPAQAQCGHHAPFQLSLPWSPGDGSSSGPSMRAVRRNMHLNTFNKNKVQLPVRAIHVYNRGVRTQLKSCPSTPM